MLIDASDANTAKLIAGYAQQIARAYNQIACPSRLEPVQAAIRLWYNPGRSSKKFFGPGIFVLGLSMFPPLLASLAMAKEGEQKTILQVYVSNISAHEFLLGKIVAFMVVALAECLLMLIVLFTYFGLSFAGDPTPFVVATILYAFCVASFGTMVGAAIPNQVGGDSSRRVRWLSTGVPAFRPDVSHPEYPGGHSLDFEFHLGQVLHRDRARRTARRRRVARHLVQGRHHSARLASCFTGSPGAKCDGMQLGVS